VNHTLITEAHLDIWFTHHPPKTKEEIEAYQKIRDAAKVFATVILEQTPAGPDQSTTFRKIREAVMTANAAIACEGATREYHQKIRTSFDSCLKNCSKFKENET